MIAITLPSTLFVTGRYSVGDPYLIRYMHTDNIGISSRSGLVHLEIREESYGSRMKVLDV